MPVVNETSDATNGSSTSYSIGAGDYFFGTLGSTSDSDWVAVTLQAGQTYTFSMVGVGALDDAVADSILRLRDSSGALIESDNDDGPGANSTITYTAGSSGTYYLDAQSFFNGYAGDYGLSMAQGDRATYDVTMGAGVLLRPAASWAATPGTSATVTWAIRTSGNDGNGFIAPSASQIAAIQSIMTMFDGISGLDFTQVNPGGTSNNATMLFAAYSSAFDGAGAYAYYPGSTAASADEGDVWLNNSSVSQTSLPIGSYSNFAIMHEIGHAVGLAHPGDYNAAPGLDITYANDAQFIQDTHQYTVMSYFDESNTTGDFGSYPDTLMLYDIYALHQLYGADTSFHAGDTTYGFNATVGGAYDFTANLDPFLSIWDGGGTDTLDLSAYWMDQYIDLAEGAFSNIAGDVGNLSIAIGAVIENAVGGSGDDTIAGNAADNSVNGGAGVDIFMLDLASTDATVTETTTGYTIVSALGTDTITGVEYIQFTDTIMALSGAPTPDMPTPGPDALTGTNAADTVWLLEGDDIYSGGAGDDSIYGNQGSDTIFGGADNDQILGGLDNDTLNGGAGHDVVSGNQGNDLVNGDAGNDTLNGGIGRDTLNGGLDNDVLNGFADADELNGEDGDDRLNGNRANDVLHGGRGNDTVNGNLQHDTLFGDSGDDVVNGGFGNDQLNGGDDNDALFGGQGSDTLRGDAGDDTLNGQLGWDVMTGGAGADVFIFTLGQDRITDFEDNIDTIELDDALWTGVLTVQEILDTYGSISGGDVVLDFDGVHQLTISSAGAITDISILLNDIDII